MLRFEEALERILALADPPMTEETVVLDDAEGRVLAETLVASADLPPFAYSAMDGYAVAAKDVSTAAVLAVRGESRTGVVPDPLVPGTAMRIFTGAELPAGADAVVMQEHVETAGDGVVFATTPRVGQHVRPRGMDLAKGAVALERGTRLGPAHVALAAALDRSDLTVARRPSVAVLATGDELRRPGTDPLPGTIPESNTVALRAMAKRVGATTRAYPFVRDDRQATERAFAAALEEADVLVTIGGVSVGDHDLVRPALEAVGVHLDFWKVAIKPGKPLAVGVKLREGRRRSTVVLGLPGNPASAIVTFALFGLPLLRAMQGDTKPFPRFQRARMTKAYAHDPGRLELARAQLTQADEGLLVTPFGNQASGAITSMAQADALVCIPEHVNGVAAGEEVDILTMADLLG